MVSTGALVHAWRRAKESPPDRVGLDADSFKLRYLQSFLLLRIVIGAVGLALPLVVWAGSGPLDGRWAVRGSLSAYYYSGMREFFTCALCATGVFLIAYKAFQNSGFRLRALLKSLAVSDSFYAVGPPANQSANDSTEVAGR